MRKVLAVDEALFPTTLARKFEEAAACSQKAARHEEMYADISYNDVQYIVDMWKARDGIPYLTATPCTFGINYNQHTDATIIGAICPNCSAFSIARIAGNQTSYKRLEVIAFEKKGWQMGPRISKVRCPYCIEDAKTAEKARMSQKVSYIAEAVSNRNDEAATKLRALRRKVKEAIEEFYPVPEKGYLSGASDETIAKKTGAAIEFVAKEREAEFGPAQVIDLKAVEIRIANMERRVKECEEKALSFMAQAEVEIKAARTLVGELKARL